MRLRLASVVVCLALAACKGGPAKDPGARAATPRAAACAEVTAHLVTFGEALETVAADAKTRGVSYAGRLELLLSFESAALQLDRELGAVREAREVEEPLRTAHSALAKSAQFARAERDALEKHARELSPLAKETQAAWTSLRTACEAKRPPADCARIRDVVEKFDAADTPADHAIAVASLAGLKISSAGLARARDRAVAASKAIEEASKARTNEAASMPAVWASVQKDLSGAMDGLVQSCKGEAPSSAELVAAERPDPRKLTVLVHVRPPAGVERALLSLAAASTDADEREFYKARAEGAFGSGFLLVKRTDDGKSELLVVTNRHVIELGDRADLELADGTSLGVAEVVYSNPIHDLAVLRPTKGDLAVREGFAFSRAPAKDQQVVIATGFPGLVGRPSYQTTKGYVSNESFKLDDGTRPLTYLQHTAPIDPGSSGGPLTDESGRVLGVNTLKVAGRDSVGLAVPSRFVLDTLRAAASIEARHASPPDREKSARLACLAFLAELGAAEPRMLVLEQMISNHLVGDTGLDAASALGGEEAFEQLWNTDSVRAMRIATLVQVRAAFMLGGGPSVLETCADPDPAGAREDEAKYHVRLGNFETRDVALRWEHGRWKVDGFAAPRAAPRASARKPASPKKLPPPGPPPGSRRPSRKVTPPRGR
ncbi:MAG: trypsin-like peptidase domain-containing protein [Labilithrix sp.]|nr:trypsin-like peptidase domain-containing protein [Labilithrix sp.]